MDEKGLLRKKRKGNPFLVTSNKERKQRDVFGLVGFYPILSDTTLGDQLDV